MRKFPFSLIDQQCNNSETKNKMKPSKFVLLKIFEFI